MSYIHLNIEEGSCLWEYYKMRKLIKSFIPPKLNTLLPEFGMVYYLHN